MFYVTINFGDVMKMADVDLTKITPMMRQYIDIKNKNKDKKL